MRVLVSCVPALGHLLPTLPLATALRSAGHAVEYMTSGDLAPALESAGFAVHPVGPPFAEQIAEAINRRPNTPLATPLDQQRFAFQQLFSEVRVDMTLPDARDVVAKEHPDLMIADTADFVAPLAAACAAVPNATIGVGLLIRDEWLHMAAAGVAGAWKAAGLQPPNDCGLYRHLYLNQWPVPLQRSEVAAVATAQDLRPTDVTTASAVDDEIARLGVDRPLIYVTFGTIFADVRLIQIVLAGLRHLDVDVLVTTGPAVSPADVVHHHPHAVIRSFVAQGTILPRCSLVITHGGAGSVIGPLGHAVPLLVIPLGADQAENAERVQLVGAGRTLTADLLTARDVEATAAGLLDDPDTRAAAARIRLAIDAMPSAQEICSRCESLV